MPRDAAWIAARLPHAGRMSLLDRVVACDAERICCEATSHRDTANPMRCGGRLGAACAVEYAAQAMALHAAALREGEEQGPPERGLLVAIRDLRLSVDRLEDLPAPLRIVARRLQASGRAVAYEFEVRCGDGHLVAHGRATLTREA